MNWRTGRCKGLIAWVFKATLVIAHHTQHTPDELAILAPAFETGCLILLLSKSTDKYFQPTLSVMIASSNWSYGVSLRKQRFLVVGSIVGMFLAVVFFFGEQILGLYGDDFVEAYPAMCLVAFGSSVWTLFSLAPAVLLFTGGQRGLLVNLIIHGGLLAVLTNILFRYAGATGAAIAYAISISSLAFVSYRLAARRLSQMQLVNMQQIAEEITARHAALEESP